MLKMGVDAVPSGRYRSIALFAAILAAAALLRGAVRIASRLRFLHTARLIEVDLRQDLWSACWRRMPPSSTTTAPATSSRASPTTCPTSG